ncbi:hypothetical protein NDU88_004389 [Pleurodeles waltl]|uniref:Uncharacterized protein n=1 Tax=Pleurodeles waltl TaxID=8319 RepID=A0AAV7PCC3_PLEWA|nr:hypothetical protein NDU88_004389 [Pleurodeles waltl]
MQRMRRSQPATIAHRTATLGCIEQHRDWETQLLLPQPQYLHRTTATIIHAVSKAKLATAASRLQATQNSLPPTGISAARARGLRPQSEPREAGCDKQALIETLAVIIDRTVVSAVNTGNQQSYCEC